jgi:anti-anti-sigma factor
MRDVYELMFAETFEGAVARVRGEIDMATAPAIGVAVLPAIDKGLLELDMTDVAFIDSAGVRMMVDIARRAESAPLALRLVAPQGSIVHRMLELTGVDRLFTIVDAATEVRPGSWRAS